MEKHSINSICEQYDLKVENLNHFIPNHNITLPDNFNIGYVMGCSGSGKSLLKNKLLQNTEVFVETPINYDENKTVISIVPYTELLFAVGLNSIPRWVNPIKYLSDGEKFRFHLAYTLLQNLKNDKIILIDEFCSKVDINTSISVSNSLLKFVKKHNKKIIVFGLFYHYINYLKPNFIYNTDFKTLEYPLKFKNNKVKLKIEYQTDWKNSKDKWIKVFSQHHYLNDHLSSCFIFHLYFNNELCGHLSYRMTVSKNFGKFVQVHRLVILPKFQGLGLGFIFLYKLMGVLKYSYPEKVFSITTSHTKIIDILKKDNTNWFLKSNNNKPRGQYINNHTGKLTGKGNINRITGIFKYIGKEVCVKSKFTQIECGIEKQKWELEFNQIIK
jgi:ABC-type lipoprotein export system ATPase subunit